MSARRDLVAEVLRRTGSDPCGRALTVLADDDPPDRVDALLVRDHLGHCFPCAALERAMTALRRDLPALATRDAPDLVPAVLARTTRRPTVSRDLTERARAWVVRPRFAVEIGYVAAVLTLAVLSITGISGEVAGAAMAPGDEVPGAVRRASRSGAQAVGTAGNWVARRITGTGRAIAQRMSARSQTPPIGGSAASAATASGEDDERE